MVGPSAATATTPKAGAAAPTKVGKKTAAGTLMKTVAKSARIAKSMTSITTAAVEEEKMDPGSVKHGKEVCFVLRCFVIFQCLLVRCMFAQWRCSSTVSRPQHDGRYRGGGKKRVISDQKNKGYLLGGLNFQFRRGRSSLRLIYYRPCFSSIKHSLLLMPPTFIATTLVTSVKCAVLLAKKAQMPAGIRTPYSAPDDFWNARVRPTVAIYCGKLYAVRPLFCADTHRLSLLFSCPLTHRCR